MLKTWSVTLSYTITQKWAFKYWEKSLNESYSYKAMEHHYVAEGPHVLTLVLISHNQKPEIIK